MVLTDAPFPGWKMTVDDRPAQLYWVNGDLHRAVYVPAGSHDIRFSYFPDTLKAGMVVSIPAWLSEFGYLGWGARRRRLERRPV